jgi:hypothetical protein
MCVVNALLKGEIEDRSVRGPVDGHFLVWWVVDNAVWTDSWQRIVGLGCGMIGVGIGEERAQKVLALQGLQGVERQVRLARWTQRTAWWREKWGEVVDMSRCRVLAYDRSVHMGFAGVHHKTFGFLGWATKPRLEAQRVEMGSRRVEMLRCQGTRGEIAGLASGRHRLQPRCGHLMKNVCHLTKVPLRGVYLYLSSRGRMVIYPT